MERPKRSVAARIGLTVVALLTGWHVFASFLWISPPSELRALVPGNLLTEYMIPWYGQSWSVFAPEPINGDHHFKVRAQVKNEDGTFRETEWVDAAVAELSLSRYNLFPPRGSGLGAQMSSDFRDDFMKLTDEQKEIAKLNYYKGDDWLGRMKIEMDGGKTDPNVISYIVSERYASGYAAQVARAVWGEGVEQVQFQVMRQNVIPFEQRNDPKAVRPGEQIIETGWRGMLELEGQSQEAFAKTFRDALRRSGQ